MMLKKSEKNEIKKEGDMNGTKGEGRLETIIGKGTKVEGSIEIEGATRIDGIVTGKLISNDVVTVGATGVVKAEIRAKAIIIGGKVEGNIIASEKVELQAKSELIGDITSKSLLVEHGAMFHGSSKMKDSSSGPNLAFPRQDQPK